MTVFTVQAIDADGAPVGEPIQIEALENATAACVAAVRAYTPRRAKHRDALEYRCRVEHPDLSTHHRVQVSLEVEEVIPDLAEEDWPFWLRALRGTGDRDKPVAIASAKHELLNILIRGERIEGEAALRCIDPLWFSPLQRYQLINALAPLRLRYQEARRLLDRLGGDQPIDRVRDILNVPELTPRRLRHALKVSQRSGDPVALAYVAEHAIGLFEASSGDGRSSA